MLCCRTPLFSGARPFARPLQKPCWASSVGRLLRMGSSVEKAIGWFEARHDVEIFDADLSAALAHAVQHRDHDNTVSFLVNLHSKITIVRACNCTHPRIRPVVPLFSFVARLIINLHEGTTRVELSEKIE